jgi:hypothetical protein
MAQYTDGTRLGIIRKDLSRYERYMPDEMLAPAPAEPETAYQRAVRRRIEAMLPVVRGDESAADRWVRERRERKLAEAKEKAALAKYGPRLTPSAQQAPANLDALIAAAIEELIERYIEPLNRATGRIIADRTGKVRDELAAAQNALARRLNIQAYKIEKLQSQNLALRKELRDFKEARAAAAAKARPAAIIKWFVDKRRYVIVPILADGRPGPTCDVRDLFSQFQIETTER